MSPRIYFNKSHEDLNSNSFVFEITIKERFSLTHEAIEDANTEDSLRWIIDLEVKNTLAKIVDYINENYLSNHSSQEEQKQVESVEILEGEVVEVVPTDSDNNKPMFLSRSSGVSEKDLKIGIFREYK
jgi:hypothetical protein